MTLTIKQMDDINVQLTEVSLELLGNKFYDIHGRQCLSLGRLITKNIGKNPNYDENQSDLMQLLGITTSGKSATTRKQYHDNNSGERPSSVQQSASRQSNSAINRSNSHGGQHTDGPIVIKERSNPKADDNTVEFRIKQSVSDETIRMATFSDRMKEKHYLKNKSRMESEYLDEFELVNEYHTKEKEDLMMESCALIEFIKFIRNQPENASKMEEITKHILSVKDQL